MFLLPLMVRLPGCRCVLASDCVDNVQACKDSVEQDLMREASRINDLVMERAAARLMEGVTEYGTATNLSWLGIPAYGKTGTAENASGVDHSWFTGYVVPEEGSPIAITVLVEQSGGRLYASSVATDVLWTLFN